MSQNEKIAYHLENIGSISQLEALRLYGIMRLASRVSDLRRRGYKIMSCFEEGSSRDGTKIKWKRYFLESEKKDGCN